MDDIEAKFVDGTLSPTFKLNGRFGPGNDSTVGESLSPETIIIVGNGAAVGANDVIEKALNAFYIKEGEDIYQFSRSGLSLDLKLALEAFIGRTMWASLQQDILSDDDGFSNVPHEQIVQVLEGIRRDAGLRNSICAALKESKIGLRKIPDAVLKALDSKSAFITTNWDDAIWDSQAFPTGLYLHGRCAFGPSLILPTEMAMDDKIHGFALKKIKESSTSIEIYAKIREAVGDCMDYWAWSTSNNHVMFQKWIEEAKKIVVWGCAFNTYDAELLSLLRIAVFKSVKGGRAPKEVTVVNSNGSHAHLAAGILGAKEFVGIIPNE